MSRRSGDAIAEKKAKAARKKQPTFRGFVNHTLTREDKAEYARFEIVEDFEENLLPSLLSEGYRISFTWDSRTEAFMAALSTKDPDVINLGLVLTARSGFGAMQAGLRVAFLHYYVFDEIWPDPETNQQYVDEWEVEPPDTPEDS